MQSLSLVKTIQYSWSDRQGANFNTTHLFHTDRSHFAPSIKEKPGKYLNTQLKQWFHFGGFSCGGGPNVNCSTIRLLVETPPNMFLLLQWYDNYLKHFQPVNSDTDWSMFNKCVYNNNVRTWSVITSCGLPPWGQGLVGEHLPSTHLLFDLLGRDVVFEMVPPGKSGTKQAQGFPCARGTLQNPICPLKDTDRDRPWFSPNP